MSSSLKRTIIQKSIVLLFLLILLTQLTTISLLTTSRLSRDQWQWIKGLVKIESKNKLNFSNCDEKETKVIHLQKSLFGTDLWFTGLGMSINELWDPKDPILLEGELYRYKPGLELNYISRWWQITTKVFRVYKNKMSAKGFIDKPIIVLPLYVISEVKRIKFKAPSTKSKSYKDTKILGQNQFEFIYKESIINEIMFEFLESKGMINTTGDQSSLTEMNNIDEDIKEKLEILKYNMSSNQPFKIDSKTYTINNASSWSNREGEWFLAEKRLLFSTKRVQDLEDWLQWLKQIFQK